MASHFDKKLAAMFSLELFQMDNIVAFKGQKVVHEIINLLSLETDLVVKDHKNQLIQELANQIKFGHLHPFHANYFTLEIDYKLNVQKS